MEDLELIQSIHSGRSQDYAHLVRKYQARMIRFCSSMLSDSILAEDAAQEIFFKAYRALAAFRNDSSFSTWLYRIGANHCKDMLKKRSREKTQSWEALVEEKGEQIEELLASDAGQLSSLANRELADKLLSQLPPDYRIILTLREAEGLSYEEIAETLKCSLDAVKARLRRAREALQIKLRHFSKPMSV